MKKPGKKILVANILLLLTATSSWAWWWTKRLPQKASLATIAVHKMANSGKDVTLFQWKEGIFVLDTMDYEVQGRYFARITVSTRLGKVVNDQELADYFSANKKNATSYAGAYTQNALGLAWFYNQAAEHGIPLSKEEQNLQNIALDIGALKRNGKTLEPTNTSIMSVSHFMASLYAPEKILENVASTERSGRTSVLEHELMHALYNTNQEFNKACHQIWDGLSDEDRNFYTAFLYLKGYPREATDLIINEFQAHMGNSTYQIQEDIGGMAALAFSKGDRVAIPFTRHLIHFACGLQKLSAENPDIEEQMLRLVKESDEAARKKLLAYLAADSCTIPVTRNELRAKLTPYTAE